MLAQHSFGHPQLPPHPKGSQCHMALASHPQAGSGLPAKMQLTGTFYFFKKTDLPIAMLGAREKDENV